MFVNTNQLSEQINRKFYEVTANEVTTNNIVAEASSFSILRNLENTLKLSATQQGKKQFLDDELLEKATKDCNQQVLEILRKYKNNQNSEPALYNAIRNKDYMSARILIANHACVEYENFIVDDARFKYKCDPVLTIALDESPDVPYDFVKLLIDEGANVNYNHQAFDPDYYQYGDAFHSSHGYPALVLASNCERLDLIKLLLESHANVNATFTYFAHSYTPLSWVCTSQHREHLEIAKLLLQYGADPNLCDPLYHTTYNVCEYSQGRVNPEANQVAFDMIRLLLENNADMQQKIEIGSHDQLGEYYIVKTTTPYLESGRCPELRALFDSYRKL
jgi:ankyrin repeat protein